MAGLRAPTPPTPGTPDADSAILLFEPHTGREYATARRDEVLLSSARRSWTSPMVFEVHQMAPHEYDEHVVVGHQLMVNLGPAVGLAWKEGDRHREGDLATGALCIQSGGDSNAPSWRDEMSFTTASIPSSMIAALLGERAPSPDATFAKRHCVSDLCAHGYVVSLASELASPSEPLFAEALSQAFLLHLLRTYGRSGGRKRLEPKGKLGPAQLRRTIELVHERLGSDLSLDLMARVAGYSQFQFARLFKATIGMTPHQFVLRMRLERASRMLRERNRSLVDVALATGFFDQAHFTNVFRRAFGTTPAAFASSACA
jgi:AraC family transcriptional regulator